jgi:Ca2+-binding RTX toxin-like protein
MRLGDGDAEAAGEGLSALDGTKAVFSTAQIVNNFLRSNAAWSPGSVITYSFREAKPPNADSKVSFVPMSGIEREMTRAAFDLVSDLVNLSFVEAPDDYRATGSSNRIYLGKDAAAPSYEWGHAVRWTVPGFGRRLITASEIYVSDQAQASRAWMAGGYNFQALVHEILHALGIPHPGNYNANGETITYAANAEYAQDSRQFTVMSYFSAASTGADHQTAGESGGLWSPATPMLHDVAALQALYGANMAVRGGDTVYGYNSTAGRAVYDFAAWFRPVIAPDGRAINPAPVFTIWDGGGVDKIDFSQTNFPVNVDLTPGAFSDAFDMTNNISIALGAIVENAVGGSAADRLSGNGVGNHLIGGAGDDILSGKSGDDLLEGGPGADTLFGDDGVDSLQGGLGNDRLFGQEGDDLIGGQEGNDEIDGWNGDDVIFGDAGDDRANGGSGNDRMSGGDGDDIMGGQDGNDFLDGGQGRDVLFGDGGDDHIIGWTDNDRLHGGDGDDLIGGQQGDDFIDGGQGRDNLFGDDGNDHIIGWTDDDRLHGGDGDDLLGGQQGDDFIDGGQGRDNIFGDEGNDHLIGGSGDDRLHGGSGDDLIGGQQGDDFIDGGEGRDILFGDDGNDHIIGWTDNDRLHGQDGDDLLGGQDGDDYLDGGEGRDTLFGDAGADILVGGGGADILIGGAGADRFIFRSLGDSSVGAADRIVDFDAGAGDVVDLSAIDADTGTPGDQAFVFVSGFSGRPGEVVLAFNSTLGVSSLLLDVNGDSQADFQLDFSGFIGSPAGFAL